MAFIKLSIEEPRTNDPNDANYKVNQEVNFRGSIVKPEELPDVPLFYRWYSSFNTDVNKEQYAMSPALESAEEIYTRRISQMGSHVITFAVSDQRDEKDVNFNNIQYGGVTGGRPSGYPEEQPCIIHVFKANIVEPHDNQHLPRTDLKLIAEAPLLWNDAHYQEINRLAYCWKLESLEGTPDESFNSGILNQTQLSFIPGTARTLPTVSYTVPPEFDPKFGSKPEKKFRIILTVVNKDTPKISQDEIRIEVTLTG